jgi:trk system potassium uptake protein TrkH
MLVRVIGLLLLVEAAFMSLPLITALFYHEKEITHLIISIGLTAGSGCIMMSIRPKSLEMGKREAILLTGLVWIIMSLFGMLPLLLCGSHINVTDAFFESMSGFTTTGATVLASLKDIPRSILLWRCIEQWIGGMGIILFTLAVVPMLNYQGGIQLFNAEVTGITHDKLRPRVSLTAKSLWLVYIIMTCILIVLLSFSEMDIFESVCHGLSIMSTGGFSTEDMAIEAWDSNYIKIVMLLFMFLGGVNFSLIYKSAMGNFSPALKNDPLKWYVSIILICSVLMSFNLLIHGLYDGIEDLILDPIFQSVSILSTTGLIEPDFKYWGSFNIIVLLFMMLIGACAGSTSGAIKVDRLIVLIRFLKNEFYKMIHPGAVTTVCINGKGTPNMVIQKVLGFLFLYLIVIIAGGTILTLLGIPPADSFFCSLGAISNIGLGTDATGLSGDYSAIPNLAKWTLSIIMLTGRLELYTILLLLMPSFWKK